MEHFEKLTCRIDRCIQVSPNANDCKRHRKTHFKGTWKCPYCNRVFGRPDSLKRHLTNPKDNDNHGNGDNDDEGSERSDDSLDGRRDNTARITAKRKKCIERATREKGPPESWRVNMMDFLCGEEVGDYPLTPMSEIWPEVKRKLEEERSKVAESALVDGGYR